MAVIKITQDNFEAEVLKSDKPVLLDFWATWCMPCQMLSPVIDQIADEQPSIKVGKVNIDEEPGLAASFGVMSTPPLVVMKDGKPAAKTMGVQPKASVLKLLGL